MPHLRFRGFDEAALEKAVPALIPRLAGILGCPEDWLTAEIVATRFLTPPGAPMVEVLWFARPDAVRDLFAAALVAPETEAGRPAPTVVFLPLGKGDYYEDGKNFA